MWSCSELKGSVCCLSGIVGNCTIEIELLAARTLHHLTVWMRLKLEKEQQNVFTSPC